jgi:hypothetical protein
VRIRAARARAGPLRVGRIQAGVRDGAPALLHDPVRRETVVRHQVECCIARKTSSVDGWLARARGVWNAWACTAETERTAVCVCVRGRHADPFLCPSSLESLIHSALPHSGQERTRLLAHSSAPHHRPHAPPLAPPPLPPCFRSDSIEYLCRSTR